MTVNQIRNLVGQDELNLWAAYVDENGPLNPSLRLEAAIARAVVPFLKGAKPKDLMPWPKEPEPEATPESMLMMFKNLASKSKKAH